MSTAKINAWVTRVGAPCEIDTEREWYVHVLHCNGKPLKWCNREFTNIKTKCAHVEIEVPPGCYLVCATWSPGAGQNLGNHLTHLVIVRVNCGDHACVTLFPPTVHFCGHWYLTALNEHIALNALPRQAGDAARAVVEAIGKLQQHIPQDELTKGLAEIKPPPK
jgi:hypothetical protein